MGTILAEVASAHGAIEVTDEVLAREHPDWNLPAVRRATGVGRRHHIGPHETSRTLALDACHALLERRPELVDLVDLVLVVGQTPAQAIPSTACLLHGDLGLPEHVGALDLGAACSGYVYGLVVADALLAAGRAREVLLVTAETYSTVTDPDDRGTRTLFGDAASATWLRWSDDAGSGILDALWATRGLDHGRLETVAAADEPARLHMDGRAVLSFTFAAVPAQVRTLLGRNGLEIGDVDRFLFHQASALVLDGLEDALGLTRAQAPRSLAEHANTVSSSIPLLIESVRAEGPLRPGDLAVLSGFGAGLSWASVLLRW